MGRDMKPCVGFHEVPITEHNRAHCFKSCAPRVVEHLVANGMRDNQLKDGGGAHLSEQNTFEQVAGQYLEQDMVNITQYLDLRA